MTRAGNAAEQLGEVKPDRNLGTRRDREFPLHLRRIGVRRRIPALDLEYPDRGCRRQRGTGHDDRSRMCGTVRRGEGVCATAVGYPIRRRRRVRIGGPVRQRGVGGGQLIAAGIDAVENRTRNLRVVIDAPDGREITRPAIGLHDDGGEIVQLRFTGIRQRDRNADRAAAADDGVVFVDGHGGIRFEQIGDCHCPLCLYHQQRHIGAHGAAYLHCR